ncbi:MULTISPECIES: phage tail protein I [unclassified Paenibacillus]|uniref:phage tail protein I n=1 Tax=unclassified Paenibacillus TaxID=185978 RepID=UPI00290D4EAB|nr:phage tail protein I [Paenibacillus macerans]
MTNIQTVSLVDILPANLLRDNRIKAAARALDRELQDISLAADRLTLLDNISSLPDEWIDELLWEYHVEGVDLAITRGEEENLVLNSINVHRKKGTKAALKRILELLGMRGAVEEWFEYGGDPYTFRIEILEVTRPITQEMLAQLDDLIMQYKNTRSHMRDFNIYLSTTGTAYGIWGMQSGEVITVYPKEA